MGIWKANAFRGVGLLTLLIPVFFFASAETVEELLSLNANSYLFLVLNALLSNTVGDVFYLAAIRSIGVSLAVPITSTYPLAITLISWFWFGEVLTFSVLSGTFSIVMGLVLLNIRATEAHGVSRSCHLRGFVFAILAAMCWAIGMSLNKHLTLHGVSPTSITFWRSFFFSLMAIAFFPLFTHGEKETRRVSFGGALSAAGAGIIALFVGGWLYTTSLSMIPMNVATPIASSSPLIAAVFACAFMGESLRPIQWLGIVFVVGGAVTVGA